jgi:O-acetyl-ADP-ribose deacetylase (regulator of RNase III)
LPERDINYIPFFSSIIYASSSPFVISCSGIFGFPKGRCAKILVEESKSFLQGNNDDSISNNTQSTLHIIEFCIFDDETLDYFENELANISNTIRNE